VGSQDNVKLTVGDSTTLSPRRITPEDLANIDTELRGFSPKVSWTIEDEQGKHEGNDLSAVLGNVIWESVKGFDCTSRHRPPEEFTFESTRVVIDTLLPGGKGIFVHWTADRAFEREAAERAYKKIVLSLRQLPKAPKRNVYTTKAAEEERQVAEQQQAAEEERQAGEQKQAAEQKQQAAEARRWWRRVRNAVPGWILLFVSGIAASVVAGVILLLVFG